MKLKHLRLFPIATPRETGISNQHVIVRLETDDGAVSWGDGPHACLRLMALAEAAHAGVLIGTTQELSLGTAAIAHLGAAARVLDYASDCIGPRLYTQDVVKTPVQYEAGHLLVPSGPGLGVEVDENALAAMTRDAHWTFGVNLKGVLDRTPGPHATT